MQKMVKKRKSATKMLSGWSKSVNRMPVNSALHDVCDRDDLETVQRLISADPHAGECLGKFDRTPLHVAAKRGSVSICKALLDAVHPDQLSSHLSLSTSHGFSVLYCAVLSGSTDLVQFLASSSSQYPIDLEAGDLGGLRPLHIAAEKGYPGIVQTLVLAGCDPAATDSIGRTALDWARAKGHEECVSLLLL
jgi:ankyrin repeat protein